MTDHKLYKCPDPCPNPGACMFCDGDLASCIVCHGAEATLPADCPGRLMTSDEQDAVQMGALDFIKGEWVGK